MRSLIAALLFLFATSSLATPVADTDEIPPSIELVFGVYKTDKATEMYRQFSPVIELLTEKVAADLNRDVDIQLRIFRSYQEGLDALVNEEVDFVRFGPASYVMAKDRNDSLQLLAMEEKGGNTRFNGLIVARADSGLTSLADLRGKSFAFGDENSTIGRFLAQERLVGADIHGKDLAGYEYLGRHDKVFRAVEVGEFDAGALKESTFKKLNKEKGNLIVLDTFENVTKPWIASSALHPRVFESLRDSLTAIQDEAILAGFKIDRFIPSTDSAYDFVRAGMKRAAAFEPEKK